MITPKYIYKKIIRNIKNLVFEDVRRFFHRDNIFTIKHKGISTLFYLPDRRDCLEQGIIVENKFFECDMLDQINILLDENSVVLDIGANIGNHTLYFLNISKVKKVYSFEPQKYICGVLKKNVEINNLEGKVHLTNIALGESESRKKINIPKKRLLRLNYGCAAMLEEKGDTKVLPLDKIKIKEKIDLIKIDTEGFEAKILRGARKTIERDKPIVFIEVMPNNVDFVREYFRSLGYEQPSIMSSHSAADDYLFTHSHNINKASLEVEE